MGGGEFRYCPECGAEVIGEAPAFCAGCGTELPRGTGEVSRAAPPDAPKRATAANTQEPAAFGALAWLATVAAGVAAISAVLPWENRTVTISGTAHSVSYVGTSTIFTGTTDIVLSVLAAFACAVVALRIVRSLWAALGFVIGSGVLGVLVWKLQDEYYHFGLLEKRAETESVPVTFQGRVGTGLWLALVAASVLVLLTALITIWDIRLRRLNAN